MAVTTIYAAGRPGSRFNNAIPVAQVTYQDGKYIATCNLGVIAEADTRPACCTAAELALGIDPQYTFYRTN